MRRRCRRESAVLGLNAAGKVGFLGNINKLGIVTNDLGHISILLLNLDRYALLAQSLVEQCGGGIHQLEFLLELGGIVITDDIARRGMVDRCRDALKVIEALVALGVFRALLVGEQGVEVAEQVARVDHAPLGVAGVNGLALKANGCLGGVEALPLKLANRTAVDRVSVLAAEARYPTARHRDRFPRPGRSKCRARDGAGRDPARCVRQAP